MNSIERQQVLDEEHLRLLRIGYFVMGGLSAFYSVFGIFYAFMGVIVSSSDRAASYKPAHAPPEFIAWFLVAIGLLVFVLSAGYAALAFFTARNLRLRRSRALCLITAGLSCLSIPFGTLLGVFTFLVLCRSSVLQLFTQASSPNTLPPFLFPPPQPLE